MKNVAAIVTLFLLLITMTGLPVHSAAITPGLSLPQNTIQTVDPSILRTIILAPSELTATSADTSVELTWKDNSTNESGFEVERKSAGASFSKIATVSAGITTYADSGLIANTQYIYRVRAVTSSASSPYSNEATATINTTRVMSPIKPSTPLQPSLLTPAVPVKLSAVSLSGSEVGISWSDQSMNESGFKLERKTANKSYAEIAVIPKDTTTYKDTGLQENTIYSYRIRAFNASGTSLYSNEVTVQTPIVIYAQEFEGLKKIIKYRIGMTDYTVNGQVHTMDVSPIIINGRTYVPIRFVAEPLGAAINWEIALQKVTFTLNGTTVEMIVNSNMAKVNGVDTPIDNDPQIVPLILSERVQVPVAFAANSLGCDVAWDPTLQEITLTYPK
ncbi:MAG: hypothetical protein HPY50_07225 [Firmicutes bacterium]|nr:hypothetical protein [Bacillota bacterium]